MTKQNPSKKQLKHSHEGPSTEQQKPCFKPKKMGSEIDEIFAAKKKKRPGKDKDPDSEKPIKASTVNVKSHDKMRMAKNGKSKSMKENGLVGPTSRPKKRTADGLVIYTEEELGLGKSEAGGTPLCPFDCDCCF